MQISGKLIFILPVKTGTDKGGKWKKQDLIFEITGQYIKKICISFWGDKLNNIIPKESKRYQVDFNVESREYSGKWFTDVKAWKIIEIESEVEEQTTTIRILDDNLKNTVDTSEVDDFDFLF